MSKTKSVATLFAIGVACTLSATAQAMSFHAAPPLLYLGGSVVPNDWQMWEEAMSRYDKEITIIVLHDSGGGDSGAGRKIGNDIRQRKLATVVSGRCSSACANMFLGGVSRQYATAGDTNRQHVLGYHGSYNKITKTLNLKRTADYFVTMTDGKMSEEFVNKFIKLENKAGLMRFMHRDQRIKPTDPLVQLCNGTEERSKRDEQCAKLPDIDALSQGVITSWEVRLIPAPPKPSAEKATFASWHSSSANFLAYDGN